jgi:anti-sigma factor RsiW
MSPAGCKQPELAAQARDYVLGALGGDDAVRFEDHLVGCPACAAEVERLHGSLEMLAGLSEALRSRAVARRWVWVGAAAATLLLALAVPWWLGQRPTRRDGPVLRSVDEAKLTLVAPLGEVDAPPREMVWRLDGPPRACRAEITHGDLTSLWTGPATWANSVPVPEEIRGRLARSTRYLWRVSCDSGVELGTPYATFSITARP